MKSAFAIFVLLGSLWVLSYALKITSSRTGLTTWVHINKGFYTSCTKKTAHCLGNSFLLRLESKSNVHIICPWLQDAYSLCAFAVCVGSFNNLTCFVWATLLRKATSSSSRSFSSYLSYQCVILCKMVRKKADSLVFFSTFH